MFDALNRRLVQIKALPALVARRAAPVIQARLTKAATTRRGHVPSFSPGGPDVPIAATANGDTITVTAVDWSMAIAIDRGQPAEWIEDVRQAVADEARAK
jgi:hypothetical protein